jgi:ParB family transcriptional regulator, chromosome partitioning protein
MKKKKALGRGLDALFPEVKKTVKEDTEKFATIAIQSIKENPFQPRHCFDEEKISELAESIKECGVLQPILVRPYKKHYQIVAGERRLRAAKLSGLKDVPCIIIHVNDSQALEFALVENLQRENLNPIEEAKGYEELNTRFNMTQEEVARKVGKERSTVANSLRLLNLPKTVQEDLEFGRLSPGHARALLSLTDKKMLSRLWSMILEKGLSVRQSEAIAREFKEKKNTSKDEKITRRPPDVLALEEKFMTVFGTKVRVLPKTKNTGKIVIHYSTLDDMDRIMELVGIENQ